MANESKRVYVLRSYDKVKIGVSKDVKMRIKQLEFQGYKIQEFWYSAFCSNPYKVERLCHDCFRKCELGHEWFNVDYYKAIVGVSSIFLDNAIIDDPYFTFSVPLMNRGRYFSLDNKGKREIAWHFEQLTPAEIKIIRESRRAFWPHYM